MIKRTPKEIRAYADGFNDCYKNFTKYLKKGQEYAFEEMELIRTAVNTVALMVSERTVKTMAERLISIVVLFRINGVKYGRKMNFDTEVAEDHIGFTKTVLETLMRGMKEQAVIDDYKVYDEVRVLDEREESEEC